MMLSIISSINRWKLRVDLQPWLGAWLGLLLFAAVYGLAIVDPRNIQWLLHGDPASHYLGFAFFRQAPWSWPLGAIPQFGEPLGTSLVYTDSLPLLAIPLKLFSSWLPDEFQYFGSWMLLCYMLYGYFAASLMGRLGLRGFVLLAAVGLLLTSPALALRAYGHESLMAHWLLLASFEATLAEQKGRQGWLLLTAALIHPYFLPMLLPFAIFTWWRAPGFLRRLLFWGVMLGLTMYAAGYFIRPAGVLTAEGYGRYSANLLTFFDSMDWRKFLEYHGRPLDRTGEWSTLLPAIGQATDGQYEGFAYLGAGVLLLLLTALIPFRLKSAGDIASAQPLQPLLAIGSLLFIYALSTRVTLGPWLITELPVPDFLLGILGVFRATGRFVWPLGILLSVWACVRLTASLPKRVVTLLILLALLLQIVDLSGKWREFHHRFTPGNLAVMPDFSAPVWREFACYRRLVVLPAAPQGDDWIVPALLAVSHHQSINLAYTARSDPHASTQAEDIEKSLLAAAQPRPATAYWVRDSALLAALPQRLQAHMHAAPVGGGTLILPANCVAGQGEGGVVHR